MNTEEKVRQMMDKARGEDEVTGAEWEGFSARARRSLRMQRVVAAGVGVLLIAAAVVGAVAVFDGKDDKGLVTPVGPTDDPKATETPHSVPSETTDEADPSQAKLLSEMWLVGEDGVLSYGSRYLPVPDGTRSTEDELHAVIAALLAGPIASDAEVGASTEIPEGTELLGVEHKDEAVYIDLSSEFLEGTGKGTRQLRQAQLVFTATQFEEVDNVMLLVEGEPYLGQVNLIGRADFDEFAPPIVVEYPKVGSIVSGRTLTVSGTANVFEGTVSFELKVPGPRGITISSFTTAACGSGCRGDFTETIKLDPELQVEEMTEVTLTVYEESAEDGSRLNEVILPLTLLPGD